MKVISITRSVRHQTQPLVSDSAKLHTVNVTSVTVVAPYILNTKDMFITFTKDELHTMLGYIEARSREDSNFMDMLRKPSAPNDSGSLV